MSYQTGDKVKLLIDCPWALKDSIIEIVNWQYADIWLVTMGSGLSKFNFHINESYFELVKSANTPLTSNGVGGYLTNHGITSIPPNYKAIFGSGGGGAGSGTNEFQVGDTVKFNGPDEPVLKTGMLLTIHKIRDDGHLDCSTKDAIIPGVFMVLKEEVIKHIHSSSSGISINSHHCTWKNYKGLSYQEEYCDGCGKTKNKRGLYA